MQNRSNKIIKIIAIGIIIFVNFIIICYPNFAFSYEHKHHKIANVHRKTSIRHYSIKKANHRFKASSTTYRKVNKTIHRIVHKQINAGHTIAHTKTLKKTDKISAKQIKKLPKPTTKNAIKKINLKKISYTELKEGQKLHIKGFNDNRKTVKPTTITTINKHQENGPNFLSILGWLGVVLILIFLILPLILKKLRGVNAADIFNGKFKINDLNQFNILSTATLGQGKDIHLVEINGQKLVIGSTANNINLLTELKTNGEKFSKNCIPEENTEEILDSKIEDINKFSQNNLNRQPDNEYCNDNDLIENEEFIYYNSDTYRISRLGIYRDYIRRGDIQQSIEA